MTKRVLLLLIIIPLLSIAKDDKKESTFKQQAPVPNVRKSPEINIKSKTFVDFENSDDKALEQMQEKGFKIWKLHKGLFIKKCFAYKWNTNVGKVMIKSINESKVRIDFYEFNSDIIMTGVEGDLLSYKWFYEPSGKIRYSEKRIKQFSIIIDFTESKISVFEKKNKVLSALKDEEYYFINCN